MRTHIRRWAFTWTSAIAGLALIALIIYAIVDFVSVAAINERDTKNAQLSGELANFLLASKDEDGRNLFENPEDFSRARREATTVRLPRSFFRFLLTRETARTLRADGIVWEAPRACVTQFPLQGPQPRAAGFGLEACFAIVPLDSEGRFIYFSLKYPTTRLVRHTRPADLGEVDSLLLRFRGDRALDVRLVYQVPPLAQSRYPSRLTRFDGLHEVTGYTADGQPLRLLTAQAFERAEATGAGEQNYVTVLGRVDASLFLNTASPDLWATKVKNLRFGIDIDQSSQAGAKSTFRSPVGAVGTALSSIEQAYVSNIKSRSTLTVRSVLKGRDSTVWSSTTMGPNSPERQTDWFQRVSDRWAASLVSNFVAISPDRLNVSQVVAGRTDTIVSLQSEPVPLPAIATRAFSFLSLALLLVIALGGIWLRAVWRLQSIARSAFNSMTSKLSKLESLRHHALQRDEIGRLARVLDYLIKRARAKNMRFVHRKSTELRVATEKAKIRHATLEAIGHEIRSPLQSLMNRTANDSVYSSDLQRMARAVDALYKATSVEAGLSEGLVILESLDLAEYLRALTMNKADSGDPIEYRGPMSGVVAQFDQINLEQALQHVLDNAIRYRFAGSMIEVRLLARELSIDVEVFNQGPQIAPDRLEKIFELGESTRDGPANRGQGLFAARSLIAAMNGSVRVENQLNGVCLIFELPADPKEARLLGQ